MGVIVFDFQLSKNIFQVYQIANGQTFSDNKDVRINSSEVNVHKVTQPAPCLGRQLVR